MIGATMWIYNETIIKTPKTMVIADITYPKQIFKDSDLLSSLGIEPYVMPEQKNQRYWWNNETPRDVDTLKEQMIATVKSQVGSRLKTTDWMVIREADGGTAMNADVKAYRAAIRTEGDAKEVEINALVTLDDVINYENKPHTEVRKIKHTAEDGVETYGPETDEHTREINMTMHFDAIDPLQEVDPSFVSLVAQ